MSIYLGNIQLTGGSSGGGGGSTPIGGLSYFIPPEGTTFTSGQEVYTDADSGHVWLRSGARLTSEGTGALNASLYSDSISSFNDTGTDATVAGGNGNRFGYAYLGSGFVGTNGFVTNNSVRWGITSTMDRTITAGNSTYNSALFDGTRQASGLGSSSGPITDQSFTFHGAAANSTHMFIPGNTASAYFKWSPNSNSRYVARYIPQTILSSTTTAANLYDNTNTYLVPNESSWSFTDNDYRTQNLMMAITNAGETTERHWFMQGGRDQGTGSLVIREYTFDDTTANGGEPWTATGNTIDLETHGVTANGYTITSFQGLGNILYFKNGTTLWEFNATTRALIRTLVGLPNDELVIVPANEVPGSSREYWFWPQSTGTNIYSETDILTAPYIGTYGGTRNPIVITNSAGTAASDGRDASSETDIYLWMRIA